MKKNILTIVIMAATLINLVLSAVMIFSVVPAMNKTSNLVDKVASVVDLEIEDANKDAQDYTVEDLKPFEVKYDTSLKINLQKDNGDETLHYAVLDGIVVSFNTKADDYDTIYKAVEANPVYVNDIVKETIAEYSITTINESKIKAEAIKKMQEKYNTKCIVELSLTGFLTA